MDKGFYIKIHRAQGYIIVAVCDEEILGKTFREGEIVLDIPISFYQGERVDFERALEIIMSADIAVITGRRIVEKLEERGLISREFALRVGDQFHVQIVKEVLGSR